MHFRRFLFFDLLFLLQFMSLFEDLTGACIYTSLMRAVHKSQLPAAVLLPCILTADGFAPFMVRQKPDTNSSSISIFIPPTDSQQSGLV